MYNFSSSIVETVSFTELAYTFLKNQLIMMLWVYVWTLFHWLMWHVTTILIAGAFY